MLVEKAVSALRKKGYTVATVKHTEGDWTLDQKGKDTWRHWKAGADPVVFSSASETSIMMHAPTTLEQVTNILTREFNPDVIIIEGDKHGNYPKVAVGSIRSLKNTVMRNPELDRLLRYIERSVI
ncbi:MAG: molybdopterin-guanine dinucleotide biosynthesis protein B, partial [Methanomicrobiales archaeon]|nr:molybdopterin-guanine dinucleotide biosynthesis protein B [Methanomicrobiales archaeon]